MRSAVPRTALSAQRLIEEGSFDAGIFDLKMPGMDGLELLAWLKESEIELPVIMISAFGQVEDAVSAMKKGAEDYITKPFEPDLLIEKLKLWDSMLSVENGFESGRNNTGDSYFLGNGPEAEKLYSRMKRVARTQSNVLITGESGVGKEVSARLIHSWSGQAEAPFVALNVGGVPENLLESELFGYEKGAFTGADKMKQGLLETASGGTLFLDEIGEMPLILQVKLLRVLQDRSFRRLGGLKDLTINSRIITAINRNLENMVGEGTFRGGPLLPPECGPSGDTASQEANGRPAPSDRFSAGKAKPQDGYANRDPEPGGLGKTEKLHLSR